VLLYVFTFLVTYSDVHYYFYIKTMLGFQLFVGRLMLFCACWRIVVSNTYCVAFFVFSVFVLETFDFPTLYSTIPHEKYKKKTFKEIIHNAFYFKLEGNVTVMFSKCYIESCFLNAMESCFLNAMESCFLNAIWSHVF
jgi:hypothetical protein